ncbi:hypothetical protein Tco_0696546 [Tanacetum coccineum]
MYTEEDSDWYIAQRFVNGLYASDGEINLEKNDNLISNDFGVKHCLKYEVRKGKKLFLHSTNAIVNSGEGTITIQPDFDPFLLSSDEEGKPNLNDLETLLDFNFDEVPQTETDLPLMAYKVRLDEMIKPEEEKAMVKMKGQMLKEKKDPGAFIFPIRLEGQINENALADTGSNTNTMPYRICEQLDWDAPIMVGHGFLDTIGGNIDIPNRIFTTFDRRTRHTFRATKSEKIRIAESNLDDEEDYVIKRNDMGTPIHNSRPIGYQNNTNPAENMTLSTLESVINPFRKISMSKKATLGTYDHEAGSSRAKRSSNVETIEEALLLDLLHKIGCGDEIDQMLKISLKEAQSDEEIFFSMAWVRAFNIREPIYPELCHEFYATYEFDEVCADDELQLKKIISFRLGGPAHSLTLLEFARRLGLYHAEELEEEGLILIFKETSEWVCKCGLGDCKMDEKKGSWKSEGQSNLLWSVHFEDC